MERLKVSLANLLIDCMKVQKGETLLTVYDESMETIASALMEAAFAQELEAVGLFMKKRTRSGEEPPAMVAAAMAQSQIAILVTSFSLSHTHARRRACAEGARIASLPGVTEEMLIRTMNVDYHNVAAMGEKIKKRLEGTKTLHITSPAGTDLILPLQEGREIFNDTGLLHRPGDFGNLPAGEVAYAPEEGKTEGVLVVDGAMSGLGVLKEPLKIIVKEGMAVEMQGLGAEDLWNILEPAGEEAFSIAELGIGTNPAAVLSGQVLEDEKVMGTVHVALGNNSSMGGVVNVPVHLDGIILNPRVLLDDGQVLLADGRLCLDSV